MGSKPIKVYTKRSRSNDIDIYLSEQERKPLNVALRKTRAEHGGIRRPCPGVRLDVRVGNVKRRNLTNSVTLFDWDVGMRCGRGRGPSVEVISETSQTEKNMYLTRTNTKRPGLVSLCGTVKMHIEHIIRPNMPGSEALLLELLPRCVSEDIQ